MVLPTAIVSSQGVADSICDEMKQSYFKREFGCEYGNILLRDTYLSNLDYFGWNATFNLAYSGLFRGDSPNRFYWKNYNRLTYGQTINLPATAAMLLLRGNIAIGSGYKWHFNRWWSKVGLLFDLNVGAKYNGRNVNNIISTDLALGSWLDLEVGYRLPFKHCSLLFSDNIQTQMFGTMFVPEYGALYYEYLYGSKKNAIIFSAPHNKVGVVNKLAVDIAFKKIILQVYHYIDYQKWSANNLQFSSLQHNFGVGVVVYLLPMPTR